MSSIYNESYCHILIKELFLFSRITNQKSYSPVSSLQTENQKNVGQLLPKTGQRDKRNCPILNTNNLHKHVHYKTFFYLLFSCYCSTTESFCTMTKTEQVSTPLQFLAWQSYLAVSSIFASKIVKVPVSSSRTYLELY